MVRRGGLPKGLSPGSDGLITHGYQSEARGDAGLLNLRKLGDFAKAEDDCDTDQEKG
jgi:hypothetical protein